MLLWGFGERPIRIACWMAAIIVLFSFVYYRNSWTYTHDNCLNSIHFSIVTFTTLGYGGEAQPNSWLNILSAIQSFFGVLLIGLFIAGFASKSKEY